MLQLVTEDPPTVRALSTVASKELAAMIAKVAKHSPPVATAYRALVVELLAAKRVEEAGGADSTPASPKVASAADCPCGHPQCDFARCA